MALAILVIQYYCKHEELPTRMKTSVLIRSADLFRIIIFSLLFPNKMETMQRIEKQIFLL